MLKIYALNQFIDKFTSQFCQFHWFYFITLTYPFILTLLSRNFLLFPKCPNMIPTPPTCYLTITHLLKKFHFETRQVELCRHSHHYIHLLIFYVLWSNSTDWINFVVKKVQSFLNSTAVWAFGSLMLDSHPNKHCKECRWPDQMGHLLRAATSVGLWFCLLVPAISEAFPYRCWPPGRLLLVPTRYFPILWWNTHY